MPINKNVHDIYATVELQNAIPGIKVSVILSGQGLKTDPSNGNTSKSGNILKAFVFSNKDAWLPGEYQLDVSLSTGDTKSVKFIINE